MSISDMAWEANGRPDFDKLKIGYTGVVSPTRRYEIVSGVPATARLKQVIYVYEDDSLDDVKNVFDTPSTVVYSKQFEV